MFPGGPAVAPNGLSSALENGIFSMLLSYLSVIYMCAQGCRDILTTVFNVRTCLLPNYHTILNFSKTASAKESGKDDYVSAKFVLISLIFAFRGSV